MKPPAIAAAALGRGLALLALTVGCGGATHTAPPTTLSNHSATVGPPAMPPPLGQLILWCTQPTGTECGRAARQLAVRPTATEALPMTIFDVEWRDLEDDCVDRDLAGVLGELGAALGVPANGWVDQGGALTFEGLPRVANGGGCTNLTAAGVPDVKVQLALPRTGLVAFIRVWELADTQ